MSDVDLKQDDFDSSDAPASRSWWRWLLGLVVATILVLAAAVPLGLWWLAETRGGRSFVAQQISGLEPESGLRFEVGRIEGSLLSQFQMLDIIVYDLDGALAVIPRADVDWKPVTLISRMVSINTLHVPETRMLRMWHINPADPEDPLLPNIDVRLGRFDFTKIVLEKPVLGTLHVLTATGQADIDAGRLLLATKAATDKGDSLILDIDAEPDRDNFDMKADLKAPVGGLVDGMAKLGQPLSAKIGGAGTWKNWNGSLLANLGTGETVQNLADLSITAKEGTFHVTGDVRPQHFVPEAAHALLVPNIKLDVTAAKPKDAFELQFKAFSDAVSVSGGGQLDATDNILKDIAIEAVLKQPEAAMPGLGGQGLKATLLANGPLQAPEVKWTVAADQLRYKTETGVMGADKLLASGDVRLDGERIEVPFKVSAGQTVGLPPEMAELVANPNAQGRVVYTNGVIEAKDLQVSTKLVQASGSGRMEADGRLVAQIKANLARYSVEGFGAVTASVDANITKTATGMPDVRGKFDGRALSIVNESVRDFLGGMPRANGSFAVVNGSRLGLANLVVRSPNLNINDAKGGYDVASGGFNLDAAGRSKAYGLFTVAASGKPTEPKATLRMPNPDFGLGITNLVADLKPSQQGLHLIASGQSPQGPLNGNVMVTGFGDTGPLKMDVRRAAFAGIEARGQLVQTANGPFRGWLAADGRGLDARVDLADAGKIQQLQLRLAARRARVPLEVPIGITSGAADFTILMFPDKPTVKGGFKFNGLSRDGLVLDEVTGAADLQGLSGMARVAAKGRTREGRPMILNTALRSVPTGYAVDLDGKVGNRNLQLNKPAHIVRLKSGWELKPARLVVSGERGGNNGQLDVAGVWGPQSELRLSMKDVDLSLANAFVGGLGLGGVANGTVVTRLDKDALFPSGDADMTINGLQRAGITGLTVPVDVKMSANSVNGGLTFGASFKHKSNDLGRLIVKVLPGTGETAAERFMSGKLSGGVRYNGPVTPLWALVGMEGQELKGAVYLGADFDGTPAMPQLNGRVRTSEMVYRNAAFGTEIENIQLSGSFTGNQLQIRSLSAQTKSSSGANAITGSITGQGYVSLGAEPSLRLNAVLKSAQLANSDLVSLRMSGTVDVAGRFDQMNVGGDLTVDDARVQIVQMQNSEVPSLRVRRADQVVLPASSADFSLENVSLNVKVKAGDVIRVEGMGLDSLWKADVRITGNGANTVFSGDATLVRGDFSFASSEFKFTRGKLVFNGTPMDSSIDLQAETRADDVTAFVNISGTAGRPDLKFTSSPSLPQDEILARLLFGSSVADLSVTEAVQLATAVASMQSGGDAMGKIRRSVGVDRLRLVGDNSETGMGTGIAIGKNLTKNIYAEVLTDSQGNTLSTVQFTLSRLWSLFLEVSSLGHSSANVRYQREY